MARLTVKQVARASGVSVRTLHYYDEIGLLRPTDVGENGYRYYDRPDLLRLQQILFYRELGLPLGKIKATLDAPDFDLVAALRDHRTHLHAEMARHDDLIRTLDSTLAELTGDRIMKPQDTFKGFAPGKQAEYEDYLVDRYGGGMRDKIAESHRKVGKLSADEMKTIKAEGDAVNQAIAARIGAGDEPGSPQVQALVARHHQWVCHFWMPNAEAYAGLGQLYLDHPDFRAFYDKVDDRLVDFLAAAMKIYAERELA